MLRRSRRVEGVRESKVLLKLDDDDEAVLVNSVDAGAGVSFEPPPKDRKLARDATEALGWIEAKCERELQGIREYIEASSVSVRVSS